jgi:hypothetical protein
MPKIIQFLHTGHEATPPRGSTTIPWNCGDKHKRKFLLSKGKYVSGNNEKEACLTFWGEWEPQSYIEQLTNIGQHFPSYLNRPFLDVTVANRCHNTDPYVFGDSFKYFVCQQGVKTILRNLDPFSLVLFGSCVEGKFCLDTLFVVSDCHKKYKLSEVGMLGKEKTAFYHAGIEPLLKKKYCKKIKCTSVEDKYTYYKGVTFNERKQYENIFSFAPTRIHTNKNENEFVFKRPAIDIPDVISPRQTQGINGRVGCDYSKDKIVKIWKQIAEIIERNNLLLGTYFDEPVMVSTNKVVNNKGMFICEYLNDFQKPNKPTKR